VVVTVHEAGGTISNADDLDVMAIVSGPTDVLAAKAPRPMTEDGDVLTSVGTLAQMAVDATLWPLSSNMPVDREPHVAWSKIELA
jgi:hypothetical protein